MLRQLPSSLAPWAARTRAMQSSSSSVRSIGARRAAAQLSSSSARALSSQSTSSSTAARPSSSSPSSSAYTTRTFSTSLHPAAFSPSLPTLAGRRKSGTRLPHEDSAAHESDPAAEGESADVAESDAQRSAKLESRSKESSSTPPSSSSAAAGAAGASDDSGSNGAAPPPADGNDAAAPPTTSLSKRSVPDVYPQVLALPITRRPLFPGFYKAVVIRNPDVVAAIKDSIKRGQPYIGAFLLKDENSDSDMCAFLSLPLLEVNGADSVA